MARAAVSRFCVKTSVVTGLMAGVTLAAGWRADALAQASTVNATDVAKTAAASGEQQSEPPSILRYFRSSRGSVDDDAEAAPGPGMWHQKTSVDSEPGGESWSGIEAYRRVASFYSGATIAIFGNLRQDGLRLRTIGGAGTYKYGGRRYNAELDDAVWTEFSGVSTFRDILVGWQVSVGSTTIKAFVGRSQTANYIAPYDTATTVQGRAIGVKGSLEIWQNWTPRLWSSLDVSMARPHHAYTGQLRTGWRLGDNGFSLGAEAGTIGHVETEMRKAGLFVRYEDLAHEFSIAGGAMKARGDIPTGYISAQYLRRF